MNLNQNLTNALSLLSVEFFSRLIGFAAVTYLARVLSVSSFGIINIGLAVLSYGMILGNSGLGQYGTRKIISAGNTVESLTGDILQSRFFVSLIVFLCILIAATLFVPAASVANTVILYALTLFPASLLMEWFFYGTQKIHIISAGRIIGMGAYLFVVLATVKHSDDVELTATAWLIGAGVNTSFLIAMFKKNGYRMKFQFSFSKQLSLFKESLHLSIASIAAQIVVMFPIVFLGITATASDAGTFSAGQKTIILFLAADRIFASLFFPKITKCFIETPDKLQEIFVKTLRLVSSFSLCFSLLTFICGDVIVTSIFGYKYFDAVAIFRILLAYFALTLINSVFSFTLIGMNKESIYSKAVSWGLLISLVSTVILTHAIGIAGAAVGLVIFELTSFFVMSAQLGQIMRLNFVRILILPLFITGIFIALSTFLIIPFYGQMILALLVAVPAIVMLCGITKEELRFIKRIFS